MPQKTQDPQDIGQRYSDQAHDPFAQEANKIFNHPDMQALNDQGDAIVRDDADQKGSGGSRQSGSKDAAADEKAGLGGHSYTPPNKEGANDKNNKGKGLFGMSRKKTALIGGATGTGIGGILIAIFLSPHFIFIQAKELLTDWAFRNNSHVTLIRTSKINNVRYFANPDNCGAIAVTCKLKAGTSEKEIEKLRNAGLEIREADIKKSAKGKIYLTAMYYTDAAGKEIRVTEKNFAKVYRTQPIFLSKFESIFSMKAIGIRSKAALKKFAFFGVKRDNPIGTGTTDEEITKDMRQVLYGGEGDSSKKVTYGEDGEDGEDKPNGDQIKGMEEFDQNIQTVAEELREKALGTGPGADAVALTGDLDTFDEAKLMAVAKETAKSSVKGTLFGAVGAIDSSCSLYQMLRIVSYGAKVYKVRALIRFAGVFMTLADQAKLGKITPQMASYVGKMLIRQSVTTASKGKTFSESDLIHIATTGKAPSRGGLARFTNGTPALKAIDRVKEMISVGGASAATCSKVKSWWGQAGLFVGGIAATIATGGANAVAGAAIGAGMGILLGVVGAYLTPWLIQYAAGVVAPDPLTDPEGGYGIGNAMAAGVGAMGSQVNRAQGMRYVMRGEATEIREEGSATSQILAQSEEINDPTNPIESYMTQLATSLFPLTTSFANFNISGIFSGAASIAPSAFANVATVSADSTDYYRGDLCADEDYQKLGIATDAACNPIMSQAEEDLFNIKFHPETVNLYMTSSEGTVTDPETGQSQYFDFRNNGGEYMDMEGNPGSEFSEFIATCSDGATPLTADGYSADLSENDTDNCTDNSEKYQYFRFRIGYANELDAIEQGVDGTLGDPIQGAAPSTGTNTAGSGGDASASGLTWPLGKANWDKYRSDFVGSHYAGGGFLGNGNSSVDIAWGGIDGTPVNAILPGKVIKQPLGRASYKCAGNPNVANNGGLMIESDFNGTKVVLVYAHGKNVKYKNGQDVPAGAQIMQVGNVGNSCGSHVHMDGTANGKNFCLQDLFQAMDKGTVNFSELTSKATATCG